MECKQGRRKWKRKTINTADSFLYDRNNDIFADCPELNRIDDVSHEGNISVRSEEGLLYLPVTPQQPSVSKYSTTSHSTGKCKIRNENLVSTSLENCFTPKRTPRRSNISHINNSTSLPRLTLTSKTLVNGENKTKSSSKSGSLFTPPHSVETFKAVLDGYKTLQEIWRCTTNSKRNLLSSGHQISSGGISSLCLGQSLKGNGSVFNTSSSPLQHPTTSSTNNINIITPLKLDSKIENILGSNSGILPPASHVQNEWDELPPTQPVALLILRDVVAYVEVRTGNDNRSMGVKDQLKLLGATVSQTFNKYVTHVVFKEGLLSTYKKAVKRKVPLVSVMWIEECKKAGLKVSERLFPPYDMEPYESPNPLKKIRKMKSIQPDFENVLEQRLYKRNKKKFDLAKQNQELNHDSEPVTTDFAAQRERIVGPEWVRKVANGNGLVRTLVNVANIGPDEFKEIVNRPPSPELNGDNCASSTPLAVRLLRQLMSPKSTNERSSSLMEKMSSVELAKVNTSEMELSTDQCDSVKENQQVADVSLDIVGENIEIENIEIESQNKTTLLESDSKGNYSRMSNLMESRNNFNFSGFSDCKPLFLNTAIFNEKNKMESFKMPVCNGIWRLESQTCTSKSKNTIMNNSNATCTTIGLSQNNNCTQEVVVSQVAENSEHNFNNRMPSETSVHLECTKLSKSHKRKLLSLKELNSEDLLIVSSTDNECNLSNSSIENPHLSDEVPCKRLRLLKPIPDKICTPINMELAECVQSSIFVADGVQNKMKNVNRLVDKNLTKARRKSRRSSLDFVSSERRKSLRLTSKCADVKPSSQLPAIVCTSLHSEEVGVILTIVNKLGGYVVESIVSANTTHVVTKEPRRTINFLKGLARGCWIVKQDWVLKSLEEEKWVDEEEFELSDFSPAVQKYRLEKLSFGPTFKPDLFSKCGPIFVNPSRYPPQDDVIELITLCGGQVVSTVRTAQIVVGDAADHKGLWCVKVTWVLDSISLYYLEPIDKYLVD